MWVCIKGQWEFSRELHLLSYCSKRAKGASCLNEPACCKEDSRFTKTISYKMQTILRFIELKICHLDKKKVCKEGDGQDQFRQGHGQEQTVSLDGWK